MTDATIITVVTIICACVVTVFQLLTKRDILQLHNTVDLQTKQIAMLHQTISAQYEKINTQATTKTAEMDAAVMKAQKAQPDQSYAAYPPYRPPDAKK